jgi:hypothetical protein
MVSEGYTRGRSGEGDKKRRAEAIEGRSIGDEEKVRINSMKIYQSYKMLTGCVQFERMNTNLD